MCDSSQEIQDFIEIQIQILKRSFIRLQFKLN